MTDNSKYSIATFAAGCFWAVQRAFDRVPGVIETSVGYSQGKTDNPTYRSVVTGRTNHAESIKITFDESQLTYEELLKVFWSIHDPTSLNRQEDDVGTQYRSTALVSKEVHQKTLDKPIVTEIEEAKQFWDARKLTRSIWRRGSDVQCGA
ncbi:Peptide methionine sulfoxide reductase [Phytophthora cactorum]|nr:Peptide methionine sulfoxide reductase [Phytophthora cactorum]